MVSPFRSPQKEDKMDIKLVSKKPHKKYTVEITDASEVKELCKFLRTQKDKQLDVVINGTSTKFNSVAGRKMFVSGFQNAFRIASDQASRVAKMLNERCNTLAKQVAIAKQEAKLAKHELNDAAKKYMTRYTVMNLRKVVWEDHIAELEDDRVILKARLDKLKPKLTKKRKLKIGITQSVNN